MNPSDAKVGFGIALGCMQTALRTLKEEMVGAHEASTQEAQWRDLQDAGKLIVQEKMRAYLDAIDDMTAILSNAPALWDKHVEEIIQAGMWKEL